MQIDQRCLKCISDQGKRIGDILHLDDSEKRALEALTTQHIASFDLHSTPPHNAAPLYEAIAKHLHVYDLYETFKKNSSKRAQEFIPLCQSHLQNSAHPLLTATKTAVAGNVIDLAAVMLYDLEEELEKVYQTPFAIDDFTALETKLSQTKTLVYLADNAGEEIFDKLYIQTIRSLFPTMNVYYFVRGRPIINDLTYQEAQSSKMNDVATIIDSGVPTPGLALELMHPHAKALLEQAECVISKGMGNFECLSEVKKYPIFFLFKVKCHVVAEAVGARLGDIVCKQA